MTDTTTAPEATEVRVRNALGQKARTAGEERAAWVRRFNRWHRDHAKAGVPADTLAALYKGTAGKADRESKAGVLFLAMQAKAVKVLGKADAAALYAAGPRTVA